MSDANGTVRICAMAVKIYRTAQLLPPIAPMIPETTPNDQRRYHDYPERMPEVPLHQVPRTTHRLRTPPALDDQHRDRDREEHEEDNPDP